MAYQTCQTKTETPERAAAPGAGSDASGLRPRRRMPQPRLTAHPPAGPTLHYASDGVWAGDLGSRRDDGRRVAMLADEWVRRKAAVSVAEALRAGGYDGLTFRSVARLAGLEYDDVRRVFPSKADMAVKALLPAFEPPAGRSAFTLAGETIVARYLRFWETGDNALILRGLMCAAIHDHSLAARMEAHTMRTLIRPFAEEVRVTDAYPRARLAVSQLFGLAVSRYLLPQEPLASADIETIAAWAGPSLDYCLRGELGRTYAPSGWGVARPLAPASWPGEVWSSETQAL